MFIWVNMDYKLVCVYIYIYIYMMGLTRSPLLDEAIENDKVTLIDGATKHH